MKPGVWRVRWEMPELPPQADPKGGHHYGFRGHHLVTADLQGITETHAARYYFWLGEAAERVLYDARA